MPSCGDLLMSIANSRAANGLEPIFVMLVIAWWAYMAFEAHRTAQKLQAGEPVDEYSSLVPMRGRGDQAPVAGMALVVLGISAVAAHPRPVGFR